MSHPDAEHQPTTPSEQAKIKANPTQGSSSSEKALEIVSVGLDHPDPEDQSEPGLSPDKLNQIAEEINSNVKKNKAPNWQVESDWDETKVTVKLD